MIEGFVIHILNIIMKEEMPICYLDPELIEKFSKEIVKSKS